MSVEEQYADIYIEAELHTPIQEMIRNTELIEAKEEARKEGLEKGIEQGTMDEKIKTAKNMLNKNISIEDISDITGLPIEEINNLK